MAKYSITNAGGVGLFIKDSFNYKTVNDYHLKIRSCEEIWVKISLNSSDKIFGVIYRHPVQCLTDFQSSFEPTVEKLINQKLEYYICGDITIDLLQYDSNVHVKNYSDMLFSLGCIPLIKPPTRITSSSATLIDHIYSNNISQTTTHILFVVFRPSACNTFIE